MNNVRLRTEGDVATVTIDRPEVLNALNSETRRELVAAMREIRADDATRAVVVTGAGDRAFSAGQDLNESRTFDGAAAESWVAEWDELYEELLQFDVPVVARLNGYAIGAAFQVALLCDMRVAAESAAVGMNEMNIGIPCILGSWIIDNVAGYGAAAEITLTGEPIDAERAHQLGLVNRVVPEDDLDDEVDALVRNLADKPPVSMRLQKRWLRELQFEEELAAVSRRGAEIHAEVYESGEPEAEMSEFLDSR